jgi:hypothetical protein
MASSVDSHIGSRPSTNPTVGIRRSAESRTWRLGAARDSGVLTDDEFRHEKERLLGV